MDDALQRLRASIAQAHAIRDQVKAVRVADVARRMRTKAIVRPRSTLLPSTFRYHCTLHCSTQDAAAEKRRQQQLELSKDLQQKTFSLLEQRSSIMDDAKKLSESRATLMASAVYKGLLAFTASSQK